MLERIWFNFKVHFFAKEGKERNLIHIMNDFYYNPVKPGQLQCLVAET